RRNIGTLPSAGGRDPPPVLACGGTAAAIPEGEGGVPDPPANGEVASLRDRPFPASGGLPGQVGGAAAVDGFVVKTGDLFLFTGPSDELARGETCLYHRDTR